MQYFPDDPVVDAVATQLLDRAAKGMKTYGISMEAENRPFDQWCREAIEEALDFACYIEKARRKFGERLQEEFDLGRQHERDIIDEEAQATYDARQHDLFVHRLR
jgi:hypothetical protein